MDTFGKQYCPSPTLRVSQLIYKITNLWKFRLNRENGKTNPCFCTFRRVMTCVYKKSVLAIENWYFFNVFAKSRVFHGIIFRKKSFTITFCKPCKLFVNLWTFFFFSVPKVSHDFNEFHYSAHEATKQHIFAFCWVLLDSILQYFQKNVRLEKKNIPYYSIMSELLIALEYKQALCQTGIPPRCWAIKSLVHWILFMCSWKEWELTSFSKNILLKRESFLTWCCIQILKLKCTLILFNTVFKTAF